MQKGKRKTKDPCPVCCMHRVLCICAQIPALQVRTHLTLLVHAKELRRTTNTGRLAVHALLNATLQIRGRIDDNPDLRHILLPNHQPYLLYPSDDAIELSTLHMQQNEAPVQLIVPDGNWRQASKVHTRHPELAHVPRVHFSESRIAPHRLRKEHFAAGMSTLEAIAYAMGVLEGADVQSKLLALYDAKLHSTLRARGVAIELNSEYN